MTANKKYWTICYPGEWGQHVQETFSEEQILKSYFKYWFEKMILNGKGAEATEEHCIEDWTIVHWAHQTNEFGEKL